MRPAADETPATALNARRIQPAAADLTFAQGGVDAVQQVILRERLGEKAEGPRLDGAGFRPLFGEGRHENDRNTYDQRQ